MSRYIEVKDEAVQVAALALAKGEYQRNVLRGVESMSGSTLRGRAASFGDVYARSRANLLARIKAAGLPVAEVRGAHNLRVLVFG